MAMDWEAIFQGQGDKNRNLAASTDSKDALAPCLYGSLSTAT
jgi:O-acetyl-ADP-ribose deacetylase (regulator of RNase III)